MTRKASEYKHGCFWFTCAFHDHYVSYSVLSCLTKNSLVTQILNMPFDLVSLLIAHCILFPAMAMAMATSEHDFIFSNEDMASI